MDTWKFQRIAVYLFSTKQKNSGTREVPVVPGRGRMGPDLSQQWPERLQMEAGANPSSAASRGLFDVCGVFPLMLTSGPAPGGPRPDHPLLPRPPAQELHKVKVLGASSSSLVCGQSKPRLFPRASASHTARPPPLGGKGRTWPRGAVDSGSVFLPRKPWSASGHPRAVWESHTGEGVSARVTEVAAGASLLGPMLPLGLGSLT